MDNKNEWFTVRKDKSKKYSPNNKYPRKGELQTSNNNSKQKNSNSYCKDYLKWGYCECYKKDDWKHPELCKEKDCNCEKRHIKNNSDKAPLCIKYSYEGCCKDRNCKDIHPPLCKKVKCDQGSDCKDYHPLTFPSVCDSVNNNERCKYPKCYFWHPLVCLEKVCKNKECSLYHRKKVINKKDIVNWVCNNNLEKCIKYYENNLKASIEDQKSNNKFVVETVRKQLAKRRRYDILQYLLKNNENIILNKHRYNKDMDVYSELLWPAENIENEELFLEEFKNIMNIFLSRNFDMFKFDNNWDESIFGVISNENNKLHYSLKLKLYNYFLNEWDNSDKILSSFKNMWNLITDTTKEKMWKYLIFLLYKDHERCISFLSEGLFKEHGTQRANNVKTKIENILELLTEYPKNNNDIYHIYEIINVDWVNKVNQYISYLFIQLGNHYSTDTVNINQNCLRYGTILGLLYSKSEYSQVKVLEIVSNFDNPYIIPIFVEWYHESKVSINLPIVQRFIEEIYHKLPESKKMEIYKIEEKLGVSNLQK